MNHSRHTTIVILLALITAGCASDRQVRPDDEAMLVYRDCMNSMYGSSGTQNYSESLSANDPEIMNASSHSVIKNQQEERRRAECMQRASWEQK